MRVTREPRPALLLAADRGEADRVVVPLKPGNAGGGKRRDFWHAFEDGEEGGDWL
jgi:hypothetical protein